MKNEKQQVYLICNAHLDPVWLWEWEEGAAEAVSTFRTAAELCEANEAFVFNHNEVTLYRWVQEYEPALFKRIQQLVKAGRWHIMGGWFLQPDCNMPSGESQVRQILAGKSYFKKYFDVEPSTAINFDPFGHSRGLVQILAKSGYDSYLFGRPRADDLTLPEDDFVWEGFDGSRVMATRFTGWYESPLGQARSTIIGRMEQEVGRSPLAVLWGVGNHGGGPSRKDIQDVAQLIEERDNVEIRHATPELYFKSLSEKRTNLPVHSDDLNPWAVGCYTSQVLIKQRHRQLENAFFRVEKMVSAAAMQGRMDWPRTGLEEALHDLLNTQFHDILPGSSIERVEQSALRQADHGLEILSRLQAKAFFALAEGERKAEEGEIPVLVYNPHPVTISRTVECEFNLADRNRDSGTFMDVDVLCVGEPLPAQVEKELSTADCEWRKRIVFSAELRPGMNRFDCVPRQVPDKPAPSLNTCDGKIIFETDSLRVIINEKTGLLDRYCVNGVEYTQPNAFQPLVLNDNDDPWGMLSDRFRDVAGCFELMSPEEAAAFSGIPGSPVGPVRIVEDGAVRLVVEVLFSYGDSFICQQYKLPKLGTEIEVESRVYWFEKNRLLKLSVPVCGSAHRYLGQTAYGVQDLPVNGREAVAQKWVATVSKEGNMLSCINEGVYGSDFSEDGLRMTLLRSPAYSAHPDGDGMIQIPQDRYLPRSDQGRRTFRFWLNGGPSAQRMEQIESEALAHNEKPPALSFFPPGAGPPARPPVVLSDSTVQMSALKKSEDDDGFVVRLFEPTGQARSVTLTLPIHSRSEKIEMDPFEIKTLHIQAGTGVLTERNLLER